MISFTFIALALCAMVLGLVSAEGTRFHFCVDWDPDKNSGVATPFSATAEFAPSGTYIHCINGGRGILTVQVPQNLRKGRYCTSNAVYASADCSHGVFAVRYSGPSQWQAHQPGIGMDQNCNGVTACSWDADLFGDHGNSITCDSPAGGDCDYQTSVSWSAGAVPDTYLVWQPTGSLNT